MRQSEVDGFLAQLVDDKLIFYRGGTIVMTTERAAGAWSACPAPFPLRQNGLFRKQCIISLFRSAAEEVGGPTQS